jgi:4-amino-4-deoxy-L-arabinose transferase-like glycosyltransferase
LLERAGGERACLAIVALATAWFVGVAGWELLGPFAAGHYAAGPSFAVAAENSLRFHEPGPVPTQLLAAPPRPSDIYCHHPWGFYWLMTAFVGLLGHHDWVVRLPPLLLSGATVPLLFLVGRALWGPVSGAVAAVAFVTLPIALSFCNLGNLEVPCIFGMLWVAGASLSWLRRQRRRDLVWAIGGSAFACAIDWPAAVFVATWSLLLGLVALRPRWFHLERGAPPGRLALAIGAAACVVLGLQLCWFWRLGQLGDLWQAAELRALGRELPLRQVLGARRYWIELSFTWLAVLLGVLAAVVLAVRVVLSRRWQEGCVLAVLAAALVHYLVFTNGADVHVFWSHYFAPFYALGLGALVEGARVPLERRFAALPLVVGLLPSLAIAPDGVRALVYARLTGGRFDQHGLLIHADRDKAAFMSWLGARMPSETGARLDPSMKPSLWMSWALRHPLVQAPPPPAGMLPDQRYYLVDARFSDDSWLQALLDSFGAHVAGPFWAFDRQLLAGDVRGFAVRRRPPQDAERYFVSAFHDLHWIEPSSLVSWEVLDHFGREPAPVPALGETHDADDLRIAHNLAVARGDGARAATLLARLLEKAEPAAQVRYDDGTELLGVTRQQRSFRVWFRASGPAPEPRRFRVFSRVSRPLAWSLVPRDAQLREVGLEAAIPQTRWKRGYVYCLAFDLLERPGAEDLLGSFWGEAAARAIGRAEPLTLWRAR